jgi:DNA-binding MarR family transcriptional regulator
VAKNNLSHEWDAFNYIPLPTDEISSEFRSLSLRERAVLMAILYYYRFNGEYFASKETIAEKLGISATTVYYSIQELEKRKWIEVVRRPGYTNIIRPINRSLDYIKEKDNPVDH